jgi:hypothetical protein
MAVLIEKLRGRIGGAVTLEEMAEVFQQTRDELSQHENEALAFLAGAPEELVAPERRQAQQAYLSYRELISDGEKAIRDGAALSSLLQRLEAAADELGLALARLREIGWTARGPSSHPGANELLALLQSLGREEEREEALEEALDAALERELARVEHQAEALAGLPDFVREAQEESLSSYRDWLTGVLEAPEDDAREWEDMIEELEQWATDYSTFDLDYLLRRYSSVPTAIPAVNFALNCQRLELEELISEDMVDYAIEAALSTLKEGQQRFLGSETIGEVDRQRYEELMAQLLDGLDGLPEAEDLPALQKHGADLIGTVAELMAIHRRVEAELAGSRLDYKDQS